MRHNLPDFAAHPVTVVFHFKTTKARDEFMGQLSDGWGENFVNLDCEWTSESTTAPSVSNWDRVTVELFNDEESQPPSPTKGE